MKTKQIVILSFPRRAQKKFPQSRKVFELRRKPNPATLCRYIPSRLSSSDLGWFVLYWIDDTNYIYARNSIILGFHVTS